MSPPKKTDRASIVARRPWLTLAILAAIGAAVPWLLRDRAPDRTLVGRTTVVEAVLDDPGTPRVGVTAPTVTIVVFTDYQCPVCRATDPALERLIDRDRHVRVLFKDWPIFGVRSTAAARLALAADRQGKYLAVHRALMATRLPLTDPNLETIAKGAGVDWPKLRADLAGNGPAIDALLKRQAFEAWSLGLQGTPGYLVGPYLVRGGLDGRALAGMVEAARERRGPNANAETS
ncbi:MAG: DsbA family protein [Caulobacteraceae bacterium]